MQLPKINWITFVKDWFGLIALLFGLVTAAGFTLSAPWAAKAEVETVKQTIQSIKTDMKEESCLVLKLLYKTYEDDKKEAEKDLETNPNSTSAKVAKAEAEDTMQDIKDQIKLKCKLLTLPVNE